jgi:hypothetical protein
MTGALRTAADCETWAGRASDPWRRGRPRRVTLWRHPRAWPGEICAGTLLGGTHCARLRISQEPRPAEPPAWYVSTGSYWCDHDLPHRYRALVQGEPVIRRWEPQASRQDARTARRRDRAQQAPSAAVDAQGLLW